MRSARVELLAGPLAVLGWVLAVITIEGFGDAPSENATAADVLSYFQSEENSIYAGAFFFCIGSALLIWFASSLRSAITARGLDRLATTAFGSLVAAAALSMGFQAPHIGAALAVNVSEVPLTPEAAQALWFAGDGFFIVTEYAAASLLAAVGLATLRSRFLPTWLGWFSFVVALALVIPMIGFAALGVGFPVWILLVTFFLWREADATPELPPPA